MKYFWVALILQMAGAGIMAEYKEDGSVASMGRVRQHPINLSTKKVEAKLYPTILAAIQLQFLNLPDLKESALTGNRKLEDKKRRGKIVHRNRSRDYLKRDQLKETDTGNDEQHTKCKERFHFSNPELNHFAPCLFSMDPEKHPEKHYIPSLIRKKAHFGMIYIDKPQAKQTIETSNEAGNTQESFDNQQPISTEVQNNPLPAPIPIQRQLADSTPSGDQIQPRNALNLPSIFTRDFLANLQKNAKVRVPQDIAVPATPVTPSPVGFGFK